MSGPGEGCAGGGLLLTRDLIFTSKVTGTARALGFEVAVAGNTALAMSLLKQQRPRVVYLDLAAGSLTAPAAIAEFRKAASAGTRIVAFGSHIDADALVAARAAGCDEVMPRSKFSAELAHLIARHFSGNVPSAGQGD